MSASQRRDIPCFGQPIIETHCHLDYLDADALPAVLARARSVGVEQVVTIAVSPDNLQTVRDIAAREDDVWCTQGIHPHEAERYDDAVESRIRDGAADPRVVAIGEIGLDYYYDHADRAVQRKVFARQLAIAADLDLPVVIHSRDADDDMRAILAEHGDAIGRRGVIHSFSSGLELAEYCLDAGFCLGFNGMVTFKGADNVRAAVAATPLSRLLLETDAPYLTPVPYRGKTNAPYFLPFIAESIAAVKDEAVEDILTVAHGNSERLFFPRAGVAA
jgi:TatD DNase family protein